MAVICSVDEKKCTEGRSLWQALNRPKAWTKTGTPCLAHMRFILILTSYLDSGILFTMKALLPAGPHGCVPVPPEKRFLISLFLDLELNAKVFRLIRVLRREPWMPKCCLLSNVGVAHNPSKIRLTTEVTETRRSEKDEVWQICEQRNVAPKFANALYYWRRWEI